MCDLEIIKLVCYWCFLHYESWPPKVSVRDHIAYTLTMVRASNMGEMLRQSHHFWLRLYSGRITNDGEVITPRHFTPSIASDTTMSKKYFINPARASTFIFICITTAKVRKWRLASREILPAIITCTNKMGAACDNANYSTLANFILSCCALKYGRRIISFNRCAGNIAWLISGIMHNIL